MLVTLLTDFGTADYFVAAMKGVILSRDPGIRIVDISHEIPAHDIQAGAFTLLATYRDFPEGTVHVGVVDPGVGSSRRPVLALAGGRLFVGPDNGLFSYVLDREPDARVLHLDQPRFFRHSVSTTFHGRDIFAPVAAALAAGTPPEEVGREVTDCVRLDPLTPRPAGGGSVQGSIVHVDRFGNCVTSVSRSDLPAGAADDAIRIEVAGREISRVRHFFADPGSVPGELFGIWGSAGLLEIAADRESAAQILGARRGDPVRVEATSRKP